jgi:ABC-2 type transport system permease protein
LSANTTNVKSGSWRDLLSPLATFYQRRWLIKYFVQRETASSYRGSHLGLIWAFLSPLMMVVMFTLVFSEIIGLKFREVAGDSSLNFGLYLYCGLLPFLAYQNALTKGVNVINRNSGLVKKVVFPLEILPLISVISSLVQNTFGLGALLVVLVVLDHRLEWTVCLLPLVIIPQLLFTLGLSYLMSVAGTFVPDTRETLRAVVRATFWISPILWPAGKVPADYRFLVDYNPLAYLIEAYRNLILDGKLPGVTSTAYFSLFALALFLLGFVVFNRVKHQFADQL